MEMLPRIKNNNNKPHDYNAFAFSRKIPFKLPRGLSSPRQGIKTSK